MKKIFKVLCMLIVVVVCLCGCVDKPTPTTLDSLTIPTLKDGQIAIILRDGNTYTNYVINLKSSQTTAQDALEQLQQDYQVEVVWQESQYGAFLTKIGNLQQDESNGKYIMVLTSDAQNHGNWAGVVTYNVGDVSITDASVGVTELTVSSGTILLFEVRGY